jgi:hypothetical protein
VERRLRSHRRLACHGVEGEGMRVVGGVHRARREMAQLTEEVGRRWGGGERPARRRSEDGSWRCSALPYGSVSGRKR